MSRPRNRLAEVTAAPPAPPALPPTGFMMYPMPAVTPAQAELYQWALAQAQAVVRPAVVERNLLGYWN